MSDPVERRTPRRVAGVLLSLLLLGGAAGGGFFFHRLTTPHASALVVDAAYPAPLPPREAQSTQEGAAPAGRRIPDELPPIRLPALDGALRSLSDFRGKLLVLNFWATWCEPCRREIPLLQSLRADRGKDGVEIVGIALDYRDDVEKYAQSHGIHYPLLIGDKGGLDAANALGMDTVLPFSVFADRGGRIIALKIGELHPDEAALILDRMRDLDRGTLTLAAAREQISSGMSRLSAARGAESPASR